MPIFRLVSACVLLCTSSALSSPAADSLYAKALAKESLTATADYSFIGGSRGGIIFQQGIPLYLISQGAAGEVITKPWIGREIWSLRIKDDVAFSSASATFTGSSTNEDGSVSMTWTNGPSLPATVCLRLTPENEGTRIGFDFSIKNESDKEIVSATVPVGPSERLVSTKSEWIVPAWVGIRVGNAEKGANFGAIYPGQLNMQWFGLYNPVGLSWMVHSEDTAAYTKIFNNRRLADAMQPEWGHEIWLGPGKEYSATYRTFLTILPDKGDWNRMAAVYGDWARRQWWFYPYAQKLKARPQLARLAAGFSWLRGMPPLAEGVGGRRVDTTYEQAIDCMSGFRETYGIRPMFWFTGWFGPFDSKYPDYFPVDEKLGNFEDFTAKLRETGDFVTLHSNGIQWHNNHGGFDKNKDLAARWRGNFYMAKYLDQQLGLMSPALYAPRVILETRKMIEGGGIKGIYLDVIGHVFAQDDNPNAGYDPESLGRNNWSLSRIAYWKAVRDAFPQTYLQTEATAELNLPFVDASSGGLSEWLYQENRVILPLWELVYGDSQAFIPLNDGLGQYQFLPGHKVTPLFGAVQHFPQLGAKFDPYWLHMMRRQELIGRLVGEKMVSYDDNGSVKVSHWKDAVVVWNAGPAGDVTVDSAIGKIEFIGMPKDSVAAAFSDGSTTATGIREIRKDGKPLLTVSDPYLFVTVTKDTLTAYNPLKEAVDARVTTVLTPLQRANEVKVVSTPPNLPLPVLDGPNELHLQLPPGGAGSWR